MPTKSVKKAKNGLSVTHIWNKKPTATTKKIINRKRNIIVK